MLPVLLKVPELARAGVDAIATHAAKTQAIWIFDG
jgi:hypothetical protein